MTWADCFENEKQHARESVAELFEPLARDLQDIADDLAALRRGIEEGLSHDNQRYA